MSRDFNQENDRQNDFASDEIKGNNDNVTSEKKALTFKDWKFLKESQNKTSENVKSKSTYNNCSTSSKHRNNYNIKGPRTPIAQGARNFFAGNNALSRPLHRNNFQGMNNYISFGMNGRSFGQNNIVFNNFNGPNNNFNRSNNVGGSFNHRFDNFNGINGLENVRSELNGPNEGNNMPNSFFTSDGIYPQKDLMQKPLPNSNPFRNDQKAIQLLQQFDKSRYTKNDKKKKKGDKNSMEVKKTNSSNDKQTVAGDMKKLFNEPKVYVPNPKAKIDGKPYIPKPKIPEKNLEITKEEKKQQWKEYREAMKPFKNREFYNARRVVQRLGKKSPSELDEKQLIRLANAREIMAAHKANLTAKYANYIKDEDNSNELGELYVLKKQTIKNAEFAKTTTKQFQNYGNFGEGSSYNHFESSRKIVGGNTGFQGFVPGGLLERTTQRLSTQ